MIEKDKLTILKANELVELKVFLEKQQEALSMILVLLQEVMKTLEELDGRIETLEQQ